MTITYVVLIIIAAVFIAFCGIFIILLNQSRSNVRNMETRMQGIENNLGDISLAVRRMPDKIKIDAEDINAKIDDRMAFRQVNQPQAQVQAPIQPQPQAAPQPQVQTAPQTQVQAAADEQLKDISQLDMGRPAQPPASQPAADEAVSGISEIDEITLDDLLSTIKEAEYELASAASRKQAPLPDPEYEGDARQASGQVHSNAQPVIQGVKEAKAPSPLEAYFKNTEMKTPPKEEREVPASDEEFEIGRSGRKYTVSELESLIRD